MTRQEHGSAAGVRPAAVAGRFYPADPDALEAAVRGYLAAAESETSATGPAAVTCPKAFIVPHAGYIYSAPVAASAYIHLRPRRATVRRVVLVGPSHYVAFSGLAASSARAFATPLGEVAVDTEAIERLLALPGVQLRDAAHRSEHSLEVQLPFLQCVLERFALVPLAAGSASAESVARVVEAIWGGPETVVVVSSDLSHYHDYATARELDAATTRAIERLRPEALAEDSACGRVGVRGLLVAARRHGLGVRTVDLRNSGDTAGPTDSVVGYGAYVFS